MLDKPVAATTVSIHLQDLCEALQFVRRAMNDEELDKATRPYLCGVYLDWCREGLRVQATDGQRLHVQVLQLSDLPPKELAPRFLLRGKDVARLLKAFPAKKSRMGCKVTVGYPTRQLIVRHNGECVFEAWSHDAHHFPDLQRVIPRDAKPVARVWAARLAPILRAAVAASDRTFAAVRFAVSGENDGKLDLSANAWVGSSVACTMQATLTKRANEVEASRCLVTGYNARYMLDAVSALGPHALLRWRVNEPTSPAIWDAGDDSQFVLLIPLRV